MWSFRFRCNYRANELRANEEFCAQSQKAEDPYESVTFKKLSELAAEAIAAVMLPEVGYVIVIFDSYNL